MSEILVVGGILGVTGAAVWAHGAFAWQTLLQAGAAAIAIGLAVGVPAGFYYHLRLYRILSQRLELPKTWWLFPDRLHAHLSESERKSIQPGYALGGAGFFLFLAGALACVLGLLR